MKQKRIALTKIFSFEAAHNLVHYKGVCERLHGHSYELNVTISGFKNDFGLVMDFKILKKVVNEEIVAYLDHSYLNEKFNFKDITAENMLVWIWDKLENALKEYSNAENGLRLEKIRLFETKSSYAELKREFVYENY